MSRARNLNRTLLAVACAPDDPAGNLVREEDELVEVAFRLAAAAGLDLRGFAMDVSDWSWYIASIYWVDGIRFAAIDCFKYLLGVLAENA